MKLKIMWIRSMSWCCAGDQQQIFPSMDQRLQTCLIRSIHMIHTLPFRNISHLLIVFPKKAAKQISFQLDGIPECFLSIVSFRKLFYPKVIHTRFGGRDYVKGIQMLYGASMV